jgi:hypothetical protein
MAQVPALNRYAFLLRGKKNQVTPPKYRNSATPDPAPKMRYVFASAIVLR